MCVCALEFKMKMFLRPEHPDFWLVWTEVALLLLFSYMACRHAMLLLNHADIAAMYAGAMVCRACSLLYHTHPHSNTLLHVDMMGICANAWAIPFLCRASTLPFQALYLFTATVVYCCVNANCIWQAVARSRIPPPVLPTILLALVGSVPCVQMLLSREASFLIVAGSFFFVFGYVVFFAGKVPESLMYPGLKASIRSTWYSSHSLWHISSALGQMCFLYIPLTMNL